MPISQDGRSFQNIPAILPYEARVALLKEFRHRDNRNLLKSLEVGFFNIFCEILILHGIRFGLFGLIIIPL